MFTVSTEIGVLRVEFEHTRYDLPPKGTSLDRHLVQAKSLYGFRGRTTCQIIVQDRNDEVMTSGYATCHWNDQWDYAKGRKLALGRAIVAEEGCGYLSENSNDGGLWRGSPGCNTVRLRRLIWHAYFLMSNKPELVPWPTDFLNAVKAVNFKETTLPRKSEERLAEIEEHFYLKD